MAEKRALLVGVNNYPGVDSDLRGCVNDAHDLQALLMGKGWDGHGVKILLDRDATQARILGEIDLLIRSLKAGDEAFIAMSGHGSQVPCLHGDERDRKDEIFCSWDYDKKWDDPLSDDKLRSVLSTKDPHARLTILLDCCHSGTGTREVGKRSRFLPAPSSIGDAWNIPTNRLGVKQDDQWHTSAHMNHLLFAACGSTQTAADAEFEGRPNGAFTWAFCQAVLERSEAATGRDIHLGIRAHLRAQGYSQTPQIEGPEALRGRPLFWTGAV